MQIRLGMDPDSTRLCAALQISGRQAAGQPQHPQRDVQLQVHLLRRDRAYLQGAPLSHAGASFCAVVAVGVTRIGVLLAVRLHSKRQAVESFDEVTHHVQLLSDHQ